jgi:predicted Zn-dependent protease with MMP-like domain
MPHADWSRLETLARAEVEALLRRLPAPLRERARGLPVTYQPQPSAEQCQDGIEPDTLGLFVGPEFADEGNTATPLPPQILLFLENIWDFVEGDDATFRSEVGLTYMHELGHYLGLDEDDLFERGLE